MPARISGARRVTFARCADGRVTLDNARLAVREPAYAAAGRSTAFFAERC
jgi:hypothetical protein